MRADDTLRLMIYTHVLELTGGGLRARWMTWSPLSGRWRIAALGRFHPVDGRYELTTVRSNLGYDIYSGTDGRD
jgi:hypothetical protein